MRRSWFILAVVLALVVGAGVAYGAFQYRATVPMKGEIVVTAEPGLVVFPAAVDFAGLTIGQKGPVRTLEITNAGDVTLKRLTLTATGLPAGVIFLASQSPDTPVAPGGKWTAWVQLDIPASVTPQPLTGQIQVTAE